MLDFLSNFITDSSPLLIYISLFFAPFVQEDTAVLIAATLSAAQKTKTMPTFIVIYCGLFLSDIWKYWIGWAARKNKKGSEFAEKKHISGLENRVKDFTVITLLTARFIPLTRVPIYVACGFFRVSYIKFCIIVGITGWLYVTAVFLAIHLLDKLFGDNLKWALLVFGLTLITAVAIFHYARRNKKPL